MSISESDFTELRKRLLEYDILEDADERDKHTKALLANCEDAAKSPKSGEQEEEHPALTALREGDMATFDAVFAPHEDVDAIVEENQAGIEFAYRDVEGELDTIAHELERARDGDKAALNESFDAKLAERYAAAGRARKASTDKLLDMRRIAVEGRAEEAKSLAGENPSRVTILRSEADAAKKWQPRFTRIDGALKTVSFAVPSGGDKVAAAASNGRLTDVFHDDSRHIGSSWSRYAYKTKSVEWLVPMFIPRGQVTILAGEGGVGKSRLTIQLAMDAALRKDVWSAPFLPVAEDCKNEKIGALKASQRARPEMVVMANAEDTQDIVARRVLEIAKEFDDKARDADSHSQMEFTDAGKDGLGAGLANAMARIEFYQPRGPVWGPKDGTSRHIEVEAGLTEMGRALREWCERIGTSLLILDPLANLYASSENGRAHVAAFMCDWNAWAQRTGIAVLLVAHPPKSGSQFSGSTSWVGAARSAIVMEKVMLHKTDGEIRGGKPPKGVTEVRNVVRLAVVKGNHVKYGTTTWLRTSEGMGIKRVTFEQAWVDGDPEKRKAPSIPKEWEDAPESTGFDDA